MAVPPSPITTIRVIAENGDLLGWLVVTMRPDGPLLAIVERPKKKIS